MATTEAAKELAAALTTLRADAGTPSLRGIASRTGGKISHTTAADAFSGRRVPRWEVVASIIRSLGGDENAFRSLWVAATSQSPAPTETERIDLAFMARYRRRATDFLRSSFPDGRAGRGTFFDTYEEPQFIRLSDPIEPEAELDLAAFDAEIRHTLLLGAIASGKTMLCRALLLRHALNEADPVPFLIPLRHFANHTVPDRSIVGFIEHDLESVFQMHPPAGLIERHLEREATLIMFDGLDELQDRERLIHVSSVIRLFSATYPLARILITTAEPSHRDAIFDPSVFNAYTFKKPASESWRTALDARQPPAVSHDDATIPAEVLAALKTIADLQAQSATEPAFGLHTVTWSWATLENCLFGMLQEGDGLEQRRANALRKLHGMSLIVEAEARGLVTPSDVERLRSSLNLRNQVAHGPQASAPIPSVVVDDAVDAVIQAIRHIYEGVASRGGRA